jgi:hypothetical protein
MKAPHLSKEAQSRVLGPQRTRAEREAHFSVHLLLVTAPPVLLVPVVAWMVWRLTEEGFFAVGLMVVAPVLAALLIMAARCMIIVALEGLKEKRRTMHIGETRAHRQDVSVRTWLVRPGPGIRALQRSEEPPPGGASYPTRVR